MSTESARMSATTVATSVIVTTTESTIATMTEMVRDKGADPRDQQLKQEMRSHPK
jgi:hypothetical protein